MKKAEGIHREHVVSDGRTHFVLPAWGYLEEIEIRPLVDLPNMSLQRPIQVVIDVYDGDGNRVDINVTMVCRNVE